MLFNNSFDIIIIGGSYSGLSAAMTLGRAMKHVLVIDNGMPCNIQTPYSHNFLTQDGKSPSEISAIAKAQVKAYPTVTFIDGLAINGKKIENGFEIELSSGDIYSAKKLIFATGIKDAMPNIEGFEKCWGISVLHCPYCHGYEVKNEITGILGNGDNAFELTTLISNWTSKLILFTNGKSTLTFEQMEKLRHHQISIIEKNITKFIHSDGKIEKIIFSDLSSFYLNALYSRNSFQQHCKIPEMLGCDLTEEGYIKVNPFQETTINGILACGDNTTKLRSVANSVAMGNIAGMTASKKMILEEF